VKRAAPLVLALLLAACSAGPAARATQIYRYDPGAPAPVKRAPTPAAKLRAPMRAAEPRAPSGPPLIAGAAGEVTPGTGSNDVLAGGDASSSAPSSGGDPLVENGLGSPLCAAGGSDLSAQSRRNCATSGFEAAGAPTGDYALDVHIDTGVLGFTVATLEQDYLIGPVWMGLVWIVHTLVVALEWGFRLDLLGGSTMAEMERALRGAQTSFTRPLLAFALALAAVGVAYNGLVRRRVAETLGQAALMLAMMAGGLWVIADPVGTVGALGRWVDAVSAGTLGTLVEGSPSRPQRTLADSMSGLFTGVIGDPWCYLEFGAVRWCDEPALLDRRLRSAALQIASAAQSGGCGGGTGAEAACQVLEGEQPATRAQSAKLLRAARTNGELFLALPANQAARNSINDSASLLRALCGGSTDATACRGPTASQAEYRTQSGTAPRIGGLLLIALGSLGMLLLLGYIALNLLGSELLSLLYLLLAPAAVLAPALGDGGRAAFRAWAGRLTGAVVSKLLFSFLLGVVLLLTRTLLGLYAFGWWTRWLLVSATWWGAYLQRRRIMGFVQGELRAARGYAGRDRTRYIGHEAAPRHTSRPESIARRAQRALESPLAAVRGARWARDRLSGPPPLADPRRPSKDAVPRDTWTTGRMQATQMLEREHAQANVDLAEAPRVQAEVGEKRGQLERVRAARARAAAAGQTRRTTALDVRARRIEAELARRERRLRVARKQAAAGEWALRLTGTPYTRGDVERRERFLDAQAGLPPATRQRAALQRAGQRRDGQRRDGQRRDGQRRDGSPGDGLQRDYAALAGLVGYGREQYERLDPRHRRQARLQIDRELALRHGSLSPRTASSQAPSLAPRWGDPGIPGEHSSGARVSRASNAVRPSRESTAANANRESSAARGSRESVVMRDAREVQAGRKRELGLDR
jgi:hypothetical protein